VTTLLARLRAGERPPVVKLCGMRAAGDVAAARAAGADLVGLNLVPGSRRRIELDVAAALGGDRHDDVVALVADPEDGDVAAIVRALRPGWVQLHGNETLAVLEEVPRDVGVIRALDATRADLGDAIERWAPRVDLLLLDGARGGSGEVWLAGNAVVTMRAGTPWLLAGGLHAGNVAGLIDRAHPNGVDAASGIEDGGVPSAERMRAFVAAARAALRGCADEA
jgi:phosphoribosylanthranilate isomerase